MRLFTDVAARVEDPFLARAFELAERGRGTTSPNPMVGCVIVHRGRVVGEGFHAKAGGPHAEVVALSDAGDAARGATAYVTLEPCTHYGRTPPCSEALIEAGVASVVIGMPDTSSQAAGGAKELRAAGIEVRFAEDPEPFVELNEAWLHHLRRGRPYVHVKTALSLDARPTARAGVRSRVSGPESLALTMRLRSAADAVMVGAATARIDDPALTVRDPETGAPAEHQPVRIVLARTAVPDVGLFHDGLGETFALAPASAQVPAGVSFVRYDTGGEPAAGLTSAFAALDTLGIRRVLVEAGPGLFTALWDSGLIDELTLVHAGGVFGTGAPVLFDPPGGPDDAVSTQLERRMMAVEAGVIGDDAVTVWRPLSAVDASARPEIDRE